MIAADTIKLNGNTSFASKGWGAHDIPTPTPNWKVNREEAEDYLNTILGPKFYAAVFSFLAGYTTTMLLANGTLKLESTITKPYKDLISELQTALKSNLRDIISISTSFENSHPVLNIILKSNSTEMSQVYSLASDIYYKHQKYIEINTDYEK